MSFSLNRYWIFLLLMVLGYGLFEYYRPKPLDWSTTYSNKDHIPFGTEVLFELLPELVDKHEVESLRIPPYNQLSKDSAVLVNTKKAGVKSSYVFINDDFEIGINDQNALLNYVNKGNTVFVSAYHFPDSLMNVLGVEAKEDARTSKDTAKVFNFTNPKIRDKKGFLFDKDDGRDYLKIKDFAHVIVLATNEDDNPVFVKVNYGKGQFFLHNLPLAFTNYYVLDSLTEKQAFHALSYLPKQPVYWDEYQKQGRFGENENSVFRYIVSQPGLKTAYLLTLAGLLLYAVFSGKRKQRVIPVMNTPKNVSLEFIETIGNMYYRQSNHANMAEKLVQHFWIYVKDRFGITYNQFTENELLVQISAKSGLSDLEMQTLFNEISENNSKWTGQRLMDLNQKLEDFYARTR